MSSKKSSQRSGGKKKGKNTSNRQANVEALTLALDLPAPPSLENQTVNEPALEVLAPSAATSSPKISSKRKKSATAKGAAPSPKAAIPEPQDEPPTSSNAPHTETSDVAPVSEKLNASQEPEAPTRFVVANAEVSTPSLSPSQASPSLAEKRPSFQQPEEQPIPETRPEPPAPPQRPVFEASPTAPSSAQIGQTKRSVPPSRPGASSIPARGTRPAKASASSRGMAPVSLRQKILQSFDGMPVWFLGFLGLWSFLPLPFGTNRPWSSDLMGVLCAFLMIAMTYAFTKKPESWAGEMPRKRLGLAAACVVAIIVWSWIQTVSWTPLPWHHPLWQETAPLTGMAPTYGAISLDLGGFQEAIIRFISYVGFFLMAFFAGRDTARAKLALHVFAATAGAYALFGLLMELFGIERVLWFPKTMYEGFVTSTFINKNSFATYAGLGLIASLALLWQQIKHRPGLNGSSFSLGVRFVAFCTSLRRRDIYYFGLPFVLFLGLLFSGSRAGFFSSAAGVFVFVSCLVVNRKGLSWRSLLAFTLLIGLLSGFWVVSGQMLLARGEEASPTLGEDAEMRLRAYNLASDAIMDNPWLGFGLGSFESAFRLYRNDTLPLRFQHAHNDYLEMAIEWGLPACGVLAIALLTLISLCLKGAMARRQLEYLPAAACAASILVGLHALADFSMQIPAIAASYAALLGLGVSQSFSARTQKNERFLSTQE